MGIEVVTISLTDSTGAIDPTGATVTITNTDLNVTLLSTTWQGEPIIANISTNTNYTVSVSAVSGKQPASQSYKAGWKTARSITFDYISGAYIEATDGTLHASSSWASSGKTANAVVLITAACSVRISLTETTLPLHSNPRESERMSAYITPASDTAAAKVDYDGAGNTAKIIQFNTKYGTNNVSYGAPYCANFSFTYPSGQKGCLPSFGQLWTVYQNLSAVNACLQVCGGTQFANGEYFSSTYHSDNANGDYFYCLDLPTTGTNWEMVTRTYKIRPVTVYE